MTLLIATSDTHPAEHDYSLGVILGEFLGLSWRRVRSPDAAGETMYVGPAPWPWSFPLRGRAELSSND